MFIGKVVNIHSFIVEEMLGRYRKFSTNDLSAQLRAT